MGKDQELLEAARTGNVGVVEKILSPKLRPRVLNQAIALASSFRRSGGPNCQDASGYTPLHHASLNGHVAVVITLLRYEAMPNIGDAKGSTPLHLASWNGHLEIVRLLISKGNKATVNMQNNDHDTSLHFAAQYGHTDVVSLLLENNADPVITNKRAETPIHLAAQYGRLEAVQQLLRCQSLLERIPPTHSLLHLAARNGHHQIVKLLLDQGCDINHTLSSGTPLHEAAVFGKADVVRVLLEYDGKLDAHIQDASGETALEKIEEHPSKKSVIISSLIKAYIRKEPLPYTEPDRPPSVNLETSDLLPGEGVRSRHSSGSPNATSFPNYQNVCILPQPSSSSLGSNPSSPPPTFVIAPVDPEPSQPEPKCEDTVPDFLPIKPNFNPLKPLRHHGSEPDLYENVSILRKKPPKKPVRSSFGIFASEDNQGKNVIRTVGQVDQSLLRSIYAKIETNDKQQKVVSESGKTAEPVVPDRNYYDSGDAGDYAQLRTDVELVINKKSVERTETEADTQQHDCQQQQQQHCDQQLDTYQHECQQQQHCSQQLDNYQHECQQEQHCSQQLDTQQHECQQQQHSNQPTDTQQHEFQQQQHSNQQIDIQQQECNQQHCNQQIEQELNVQERNSDCDSSHKTVENGAYTKKENKTQCTQQNNEKLSLNTHEHDSLLPKQSSREKENVTETVTDRNEQRDDQCQHEERNSMEVNKPELAPRPMPAPRPSIRKPQRVSAELMKV